MNSSNNGSYFFIDQKTGYILVAKDLNVRAVPYGINMTITATDQAIEGARKTASMKLNIEVMYVDNVEPVFSEDIPQNVSIAEDLAVGTIVANVKANDPDVGAKGQIRYSIIFGNERHFFKISEDSGALMVNQTMDFESKSQAPSAGYVLTIQAQDGGSPPL